MVRAILAGTKMQTRRVVNFKHVLPIGHKRAGVEISPAHATVGDLSWLPAMVGDAAGIAEQRREQQINVPYCHQADATMPWGKCGK